MGELTDRLLNRQKETYRSDGNGEGAAPGQRVSIPAVDYITITGRRVRIRKIEADHRRRLIIASKGVEGRRGNVTVKTEDWEFHKWLIKDLVDDVTTGRETYIDYSKLGMGEERDLMLGIRLATYGRVFHMTFVCPHCNHSNTPYLDPGHMKRFLMQPTQDENAWPDHHCIEINGKREHIANLLSQYDPVDDVADNKLSVDWSDLPTDYYPFVMEHHRSWACDLVDAKMTARFHLPMARDKEAIAEFYTNEDPSFIESALSYMVTSIGEVKYAEDDGTITREKRAQLQARLRSLTSLDLLLIRDRIIDEDVGIDTLIHPICDKTNGGCGAKFDTNIRMDADFFLPPRVSNSSSTRTQRYQRPSR